MCGRFILVQKLETLEKRFNAIASKNLFYKPSFNIHPGANSLIIASDNPSEIVTAVFGLTPHWAKKPMYLFNARAEGDNNKDNNPQYKGAKGIINKPSFSKAIRTQRCLVPADAFIEGTTDEGLSKPYLVYLRNKERPFSFAGIWSDWENPNTKQIIRSFSIITTVANQLLQKIPHHRSPVILTKSQEKTWINVSIPLNTITDMLKPFGSNLMNAYPITSKIKNPRNNNPELIEPIGEPILPENSIDVKDEVKSTGFGRKNRHF